MSMLLICKCHVSYQPFVATYWVPLLESLSGHAPCEEFDSLYSKALDGFVVILSNEGDLIYISESVSKYLGIQQVIITPQSSQTLSITPKHSQSLPNPPKHSQSFPKHSPNTPNHFPNTLQTHPKHTNWSVIPPDQNGYLQHHFRSCRNQGLIL